MFCWKAWLPHRDCEVTHDITMRTVDHGQHLLDVVHLTPNLTLLGIIIG